MHAYRLEYPTFRELAERADRAFRTLDQLNADIEALQEQRDEVGRSVSHLGGLVSRAIHDTARVGSVALHDLSRRRPAAGCSGRKRRCGHLRCGRSGCERV